MADNMSRYVNLCAFEKSLTIMTTAFDRARNNMPSRIPPRDIGGGPDSWKAYLSGAEAWVDQYIIQKIQRGRHVSQEAWCMWQDMFTEASSAMPSPGFEIPRHLFIKASREIQRALKDARDDTEARHTRRSHTQWTPKGRLQRIPANLWPATL
jgi:hypothetical protein